MSERTAVLLMAYGTPNSLEEVEPYYQSIRGGRQPTPEQVEELTDRYRRVGGRTRLLDITQEVAAALQQRLNAQDADRFQVYIGMKHWHPFIAEVVERIAADGIRQVIAIALAPHYSKMSIDGYRSSVQEAVDSLANPLSVRFIESWYANPLFISSMAKRIREALKRNFSSDAEEDVKVVFSAHSLPRRILQWEDPYPEELRQSCETVAKAAGLSSWQFTFQSAGRTSDPWLGPDILDTLAGLAGEGAKRALMVPIGFVSDNLEIVFDIDVEAQELAQGLGMQLARTEMPNASPDFIEALEDLVVNGTGARTSSAGR
ncbi:MAG: ferrochelatase [Chloroflexi bacterium]|nr:ferrochelatase [Chloroflexota bacterium]